MFVSALRQAANPIARTAPPAPRSGITRLKGSLQELSNSKSKQSAEHEGDATRVKLLRLGQTLKPEELAYSSRVVPPQTRRRPKLVAPTSTQAKDRDIFHQLSIDPLSLATNPFVLSKYVTDMGQIEPRLKTELTVKSQRRLGKAIRRARMMGVIPLLSKSAEARRS